MTLRDEVWVLRVMDDEGNVVSRETFFDAIEAAVKADRLEQSGFRVELQRYVPENAPPDIDLGGSDNGGGPH